MAGEFFLVNTLVELQVSSCSVNALVVLQMSHSLESFFVYTSATLQVSRPILINGWDKSGFFHGYLGGTAGESFFVGTLVFCR